MKKSAPRVLSFAIVFVAFFSQSTGAADLAFLMGPGARPAAFPVRNNTPLPPQRALIRKAEPLSKTIDRALHSFYQEASVIAVWIDQTFIKEPPQKPAAGALFPARPAPIMEEAVIAAEPTRDRILIAPSEDIIDVAELTEQLEPQLNFVLSSRPAYQERLIGPWNEGKGLRFRVNYLRPIGVTWADAQGFHAYIPGAGTAHVRSQVPPRYWRAFPIFFSKARVDYEIEIENTGALPLRAIKVFALQETFNFSGGRGRPLSGAFRPVPVKTRSIKDRTTLRSSFRLTGSGRSRINFEQTHLLITQDSAIGNGKVLADSPQAGIVDPPNR